MVKNVKKIYYLLLFVTMIFILTGCNLNIRIGDKFEQAKFTEIKYSHDSMNYNLYETIESYSKLEQMCYLYMINISKLTNYNDDYFQDNVLVLFMIAEGSGGNTHNLLTKGIRERKLILKYEMIDLGMTCDMAYWYVFYEITKAEALKLDTIEIHYSDEKVLQLMDSTDFVTNLPLNMPKDFYFKISKYHFSYDSSTGILSENDQESVVYLEESQLIEIYNLFREIEFDKYPETVNVVDEYNGYMGLSIYGENSRKSVFIWGINSPTDEWVRYQELGVVIDKIVNEYIKND